MIVAIVVAGTLLFPALPLSYPELPEISEVPEPYVFEITLSQYEKEQQEEWKREQKRIQVEQELAEQERINMQLEKERVQREQKRLQVEKERKEHEQASQWNTGFATSYWDGGGINGTGTTYSGYKLSNGITYNGKRILASDKKFPIGTFIDIKLQNGEVIHGVVLDRGGSVTGNHFDLVQGSEEECINFGRQEIKWKVVGQ